MIRLAKTLVTGLLLLTQAPPLHAATPVMFSAPGYVRQPSAIGICLGDFGVQNAAAETYVSEYSHYKWIYNKKPDHATIVDKVNNKIAEDNRYALKTLDLYRSGKWDALGIGGQGLAGIFAQYARDKNYQRYLPEIMQIQKAAFKKRYGDDFDAAPRLPTQDARSGPPVLFEWAINRCILKAMRFVLTGAPYDFQQEYALLEPDIQRWVRTETANTPPIYAVMMYEMAQDALNRNDPVAARQIATGPLMLHYAKHGQLTSEVGHFAASFPLAGIGGPQDLKQASRILDGSKQQPQSATTLAMIYDQQGYNKALVTGMLDHPLRYESTKDFDSDRYVYKYKWQAAAQDIYLRAGGRTFAQAEAARNAYSFNPIAAFFTLSAAAIDYCIKHPGLCKSQGGSSGSSSSEKPYWETRREQCNNTIQNYSGDLNSMAAASLFC